MNKLSYDDMRNIASKHGFNLVLDSICCQENQGLALEGTIFLGRFEDQEQEEMVFWHELGHLYNAKKNKHRFFLNKVSEEGAAWETGLTLAAKNKRYFHKDCSAYRWARKAFRSYSFDLDNWGKM